MAHTPLCLADFELIARRKLPRCIYEYIAGGVEDDVAMRGNRDAFEGIALRTRVLTDTSARSCAVHTLGHVWAAPFGIAPMGAMGLAALQTDLVMARAAAKANIPFILSGASLVALERVIRENANSWFQVYLTTDQGANDALVERVSVGGFRTLVITVDVPVGGNRERDMRNGYSSPLRPSFALAVDGVRHPRWLLGTFVRSLLREGMPHFENFGSTRVPMMSARATRAHQRDNLCWDDLQRLRQRWKHTLVLKGVLSAEDVVMARTVGVDAVIVSNHGGRQLDCAVAPMRVLRELRQQSGAVTVMMDSGIRRGTDVLKAMARGAAHVFLGRPFLYAAVAGGELGVLRAIALLQSELLRNMALLGLRDPDHAQLASLLVEPIAQVA